MGFGDFRRVKMRRIGRVWRDSPQFAIIFGGKPSCELFLMGITNLSAEDADSGESGSVCTTCRGRCSQDSRERYSVVVTDGGTEIAGWQESIAKWNIGIPRWRARRRIAQQGSWRPSQPGRRPLRPSPRCPYARPACPTSAAGRPGLVPVAASAPPCPPRGRFAGRGTPPGNAAGAAVDVRFILTADPQIIPAGG